MALGTESEDPGDITDDLNARKLYFPIHFFLKFCGIVARDPIDVEPETLLSKDSPLLSRRRNYSFLILVFFWIEWFRIFLSLIGDNDMFVEYFGENYNEQEHMFYEIVVLLPCAHATLTAHLFYFEEMSKPWFTSFVQLWRETKYRVAYAQDVNCNMVSRRKPKLYFYGMLYIAGGTAITTVLQYQFLRGLDYYQIIGNLFYISWIFYCSCITAFSAIYFTLTSYALTTRFKELRIDLEALREEEEKGTVITELFPDLMKLQEKFVKTCEMVEVVNSFWRYYLFLTFMLFLPFSVFSLYQIILGRHALLLDFNFVWNGGQSFVTLSFIALAASAVNLEAHSSETLIHDFSLNENLTIDQQIQIRYFTQRLTGKTIGIWCLGIFTVTESKIYDIITVVASYVFLVIDMNRGSVAPKTCPTFTNETLITLFKPKEDEVLLLETQEAQAEHLRTLSNLN